MPIGEIHGLSVVQFGTTVLNGIGSLRMATGTEVRSDPTSGEVYARHGHIAGQKIAAEFSSRDLVVALAQVPLTGKKIGDLSGGLTFYAGKHQSGGTRATGAAHRKYVFLDGIAYLTRLTAGHQADAELGLGAIAAFDGANDPVAMTENVSLPAGIADTDRFTLGPITIAGLALQQFRSLSVDFGVQAKSEGSESETWDRYTHIERIIPEITIRGVRLDWLKTANVPLLGKAPTHANTAIYLRKRKVGGAYEPDASAVHVKLTAAGIATVETPVDAQGVDAAECELRMRCTYDGTNAPIVVTTATAIS
ncbi:MAG: hypothetical protein AABZ12_10485 [Planctomycetota bacterium]